MSALSSGRGIAPALVGGLTTTPGAIYVVRVVPDGDAFRVSFRRGDPHEAEIDLGGIRVSAARRITNALEVDMPIATVERSRFGGLGDTAIIVVADNTARRLASSALEMIRPITPVDTGALVSSLTLTQLGIGSWAVTYGPFYGFFQFWGTRRIAGLRNELNDILSAVVASIPAVLDEEIKAVAA